MPGRSWALRRERNPGDPQAGRRFATVNCAYRVLAHDEEPSEMLFRDQASSSEVPSDEKYSLDNPWGLFLWWREKFF